MALLLVLVAGGVADRRSRQAAEPADGGVLARVPAAAPASARSSAWYCSGATANRAGVAHGTIVVANAGRRALNGEVTVVPSQGEAVAVPFQVAPASVASVTLTDKVAESAYVSAIVELDGGQAAVEMTTAGPLGESVAPCASSASASWYFADGVTTKDATKVVALFNPFPEDAVVDVSFTSEEGEITPQALTGLAVRGRSTTAINAGEFVQRRTGVTTSVVARTGRLAVHRLQYFDGTVGRRGLSLSLGAQSPGALWYFPEGMVADGFSERFHIFNPSSSRESEVRVTLALESGDAEPFELTVPPQSRVTITAEEQIRIPRGVPHAVTVEAVNGVDVVAERTLEHGPASGRSGTAFTPGARLATTRWVFAAGRVGELADEILTFQNPGTRAARVSVTLLRDGIHVPVQGLQDIEVGPRGRRSVRVRDHVPAGVTPFVVSSTRPIVAERGIYFGRGAGSTIVVGTALR